MEGGNGGVPGLPQVLFQKFSWAGCPISPSNYAALEGILYCKHHFAQLFKEKWSYNHLIRSASPMNHPTMPVPKA